MGLGLALPAKRFGGSCHAHAARARGPGMYASVAHMKPGPERRYTMGLISDTHGLLRPEALHALRGVDHLVHAGDIGSPDILVRLAELAPVTAVRGNNDGADWTASVPLFNDLVVGGLRIHVVHELQHLRGRVLPEGTRVVVYGHSHRPAIERTEGVLYVNPGSAGPRRFMLPVTVALLHLAGSTLDAEIVKLM